MFIHPHHGSAPPSQGHRIGFFRKLICDHLFAMTYSQRKNSAQPPLAVLKFSSPWGDAGAHESFVFFELVLVSGFGFERAKSPRPAVAPQIGFVLANWVRTCEKPASSRGRANWVRLFELVLVSENGFFRKLICDHVFAMTYSQRKNSARAPLGLLKFSFPAVRPSLIGVSNVQKARDQPWPVQIGFFRELICDYVFALTYSQRNAVLGLRRRCSNFHLRR